MDDWYVRILLPIFFMWSSAASANAVIGSSSQLHLENLNWHCLPERYGPLRNNSTYELLNEVVAMACARHHKNTTSEYHSRKKLKQKLSAHKQGK